MNSPDVHLPYCVESNVHNIWGQIKNKEKLLKIKCEWHHCPQVSFTLNEELTVIEGIEDKTVSAPREHPFTMQSVGGQMLAVFTETSSGELLICLVSALNASTARWVHKHPQIQLLHGGSGPDTDL